MKVIAKSNRAAIFDYDLYYDVLAVRMRNYDGIYESEFTTICTVYKSGIYREHLTGKTYDLSRYIPNFDALAFALNEFEKL